MALPMNNQGLAILIQRIEARAREKGAAAAAAAALVFEAQLKIELSQPGTGRVYGNHQASAPGEPPAPDTGTLRASVHTELHPDGSASVIESGPQVIGLEYGAPERGLAPRPHFRVALRKALPAMRQAAAKADPRIPPTGAA